MEQSQKSSIGHKLGLVCGIVASLLGFIGTGKLLLGREVGTALYLSMMGLFFISFILMAQRKTASNSSA